MSFFNQFQHASPSQNLQVWMCDGCESVHFKTGNVMLNLTKTEFAELTHAILEIYQSEISTIDLYSLFSSLSDEDEIISGEKIV
jgi:hypothetical protein